MKVKKYTLFSVFALGFLGLTTPCLVSAAEMPIVPNASESKKQEKRILSKEEFIASLFAAVSIPDYSLFMSILNGSQDSEVATFKHPLTGISLLEHVLSVALKVSAIDKGQRGGYRGNISWILAKLVSLAVKQKNYEYILDNSTILHRAILLNEEGLIKIIIRFGRPLLTLRVSNNQLILSAGNEQLSSGERTALDLGERSSSESIREQFMGLREKIRQNPWFQQRYPIRPLVVTQPGQHASSVPHQEPPRNRNYSALQDIPRFFRGTLQVRFDASADSVPERGSRRQPTQNKPQVSSSEQAQHDALLRELQEEIVVQGSNQEFPQEEELEAQGTEKLEEVQDTEAEDDFPALPIVSLSQLVLMCIFGLFVGSK